MRALTIRILALIGAFTLLIWVLFLIALLVAGGGPRGVPRHTVLTVDLTAPVEEDGDPSPLAWLTGERSMTLRSLVEALKGAGTDDRVEALVVRIGAGALGIAQMQELRDAVADFRSHGKKAIAYTEGMDDLGFALAGAFDLLWMPPSATLQVDGVMAAVPFVRGLLDKVGVVPRFDHRKDYKTAMNTLTERGLTGPHREMLTDLIHGLADQLVSLGAERTGLSAEDLRARVEAGPYFGSEALDAKLVDRLGYRDDLFDDLEGALGHASERLSAVAYHERRGSVHDEGPIVALIYGVGPVVPGEGDGSPFAERAMGADRIAQAFRDAAEDEDVRAILFRVDSPGGSYVASDLILRAALKAKEKGKKIVVSMGDVAASGGYFVSLAADTIVAEPGTLTGSIGVYAGKLVTRGLWEKLGIAWGQVASTGRADFWASLTDYDPEEWRRLEAFLDHVYEDFTQKVARHRHLSPDRVEAVAKGRVWTGAEALEHGLVDRLGGLEEAVAEVRRLLGLEEEAGVTLRRYPPPRPWWRRLMDAESSRRELGVLARQLRGLVAGAGLSPRGVLEAPVPRLVP